MGFAPEYVAAVLNDNFEDAKAHFLAPLMAVHYAHLVMLAAQRLIPLDDAHAIRVALDGISQPEIARAVYDGTCEDLFFYVERLLVRACGEEAAGRLHTARSRNDIDMTMYRMRQRELVLEAIGAAIGLRGVLLDLAERHVDTIFAAHTHTQRAQPTTVAHYLLAVVEQLERDHERLRGAYERTNRSPLGACAITGTGFDIDRALTASLLGFSAPVVNTYGSIAAVDYLLESASMAAVMLAGVGRFLQDLLLWSTAEFGYLRLGDGFVQTSSIMPQKRNPVALEHARALASKALGQAQAIVTAVHNTPFGDIVDTEDDLQPLVFSMFRDARRAVTLVAAALRTAIFNPARLEAGAAEGWTTLTELADTLVRDRGLPFKTAHRVAAAVMNASEQGDRRPLPEVIADASEREAGTRLAFTAEDLDRILSARHFVEVRRTLGGPAAGEARRAAAESRARLAADQEWSSSTAAALDRASRMLTARAAAI